MMNGKRFFDTYLTGSDKVKVWFFRAKRSATYRKLRVAWGKGLIRSSKIISPHNPCKNQLQAKCSATHRKLRAAWGKRFDPKFESYQLTTTPWLVYLRVWRPQEQR